MKKEKKRKKKKYVISALFDKDLVNEDGYGVVLVEVWNANIQFSFIDHFPSNFY